MRVSEEELEQLNGRLKKTDAQIRTTAVIEMFKRTPENIAMFAREKKKLKPSKPVNAPLIAISPSLLVAIDPGATTGYAILVKTGSTIRGFDSIGVGDFWSVYDKFSTFDKSQTLLIIENGGLVKHSFHRVDLRTREGIESSLLLSTQGCLSR